MYARHSRRLGLGARYGASSRHADSAKATSGLRARKAVDHGRRRAAESIRVESIKVASDAAGHTRGHSKDQLEGPGQITPIAAQVERRFEATGRILLTKAIERGDEFATEYRA